MLHGPCPSYEDVGRIIDHQSIHRDSDSNDCSSNSAATRVRDAGEVAVGEAGGVLLEEEEEEEEVVVDGEAETVKAPLMEIESTVPEGMPSPNCNKSAYFHDIFKYTELFHKDGYCVVENVIHVETLDEVCVNRQ